MGSSSQNLVGANAKVIWAGGNRYTPIDLERSRDAGHEVLVENQRYTLPDYFRTDIRFRYRKNKPKASYILSLDIQNITGRENMDSIYYDRMKGDVKTVHQMGLVLILNYRIEF